MAKKLWKGWGVMRTQDKYVSPEWCSEQRADAIRKYDEGWSTPDCQFAAESRRGEVACVRVVLMLAEDVSA